MNRTQILLFGTCVFFASCSQEASVGIERLDRVASPVAQSEIVDSFAPALDVLARIGGSVSREEAFRSYSVSAAQRVFGPDMERLLPDLSETESQLGLLRSNFEQKLPEVRFPARTFGYATPYNQSVIIADTVMLIGLNHYLGAGYPGYASFDVYRRRLKEPQRIPIDVAEAVIASGRPYETTAESTVISRMLYEGALLYALSELLPDADEAALMGYTEEELQWARRNEADAWRKMVETDMLYSTDTSLADRLVMPAPATLSVNPEAPGRFGRYLGLQIVKSYMEQNSPDGGIAFLLSPEFYSSRSTLKNAAFSPRK